jgi:lysophospholipase L1-like esterase
MSVFFLKKYNQETSSVVNNMYKPHLVFLQIGSNDISNVETTVENVLLSFELLFETLQSFGVKCVIVGS